MNTNQKMAPKHFFIFLWVVGVFSITCHSQSFAQSQTKTNDMTPQQWREDIEYLFDTLEKNHINPYHTTSKEVVDLEVQGLLSNLSRLSESEIFLHISRIVKSLDDSHTGLWRERDYYSSYPVEFFVFNNDEIRVLRPPKQHPELLGAILLGIDGKPTANWTRKVSEVAQVTDNAYSEIDRLARYMRYDKLLKALGIAEREQEADFEFLLEAFIQQE